MKYLNLKKKQLINFQKNKLETRTLQVKSKTENLSLIRDFISKAATEAGFNNDNVDNIILAVDEACTNIIKHAYKLQPDGDIVIKVKTTRSHFTINISDNGYSFQPDSIPEPDLQKYYRQKRVGGLGLYLMKTLMDDVKYVSKPGKKNQVMLTKKINLSQHNAR